MTKTLSLVAMAVMSVSLQAQTSTSPQNPDPAMTPGSTQTGSQPSSATDAATPQASQRAQTGSQPSSATDAATPQASQRAGQVQAANISAELTKGIDSKKARVGDEINAKTTSEAKLPDGTDLPKGTKLVGNVVEVKAKSKDENTSHLVLALNRAVLKDGHEMPIRSAVTSMTAPGNASADMPAGGGAVGGGGGAPSGGSDASGGGGAAASSSPSMPSSMSSSAPQSAQGEMLKNAQDRVAVGNKPKVMLSAPTTPESASVLDAQGENISLETGTKFTANVASAQGSGQGGL